MQEVNDTTLKSELIENQPTADQLNLNFQNSKTSVISENLVNVMDTSPMAAAQSPLTTPCINSASQLLKR